MKILEVLSNTHFENISVLLTRMLLPVTISHRTLNSAERQLNPPVTTLSHILKNIARPCTKRHLSNTWVF